MNDLAIQIGLRLIALLIILFGFIFVAMFFLARKTGDKPSQYMALVMAAVCAVVSFLIWTGVL